MNIRVPQVKNILDTFIFNYTIFVFIRHTFDSLCFYYY